MLLWLWPRPAAADPVGPLVWEVPYAAHAALKRQTDRQTDRQKERKKERKKIETLHDMFRCCL